MSRKQSIFETEHWLDKKQTKPSARLIELMEQDAIDSTSIDPNEMIWTGGRTPFDLPEALSNDLDDVTALDQILLAIIGSHCDFDFPPEEGSKEAKQVRKRLEQAKRNLLGQHASKGTPSQIERELVWKIAEQFWQKYAKQTDDGTLLASIAADVVMPNWKDNGFDPKEVENNTRAYINAFNKDRDRLLLRVSAKGLPEVEGRKPTVSRIIKLLSDLGIVRARTTKSRSKAL